MTTNVGKTDSAVRVVLGLVLVAAALLGGWSMFDGAVAKYAVVAIGLVLLVTGLMRTCPAYRMLGIDTCKV